MSRVKWVVPENLHRLWRAEDALMSWAEEILLGEQYLQDHIVMIEAYMDCVEFMRISGKKGDRHTALGGLFLRTFDAMSHCIRGALSGNYSGSAMYARDLLETQFLIAYLMEETGRPEAWLRAKPDTVRRDYPPRKIREALDERDGFKERKRKKNYDALSALGIHPTPAALAMKRDGTKSINSGPFKQAQLLEACIQEAARAAFPLGGLLRKYCNSEIPDGPKHSSRLSLVLQQTQVTYFDRP